ncbi:hypothetical protein [Prauserella cavernicola]|uniref:Secreted protein n=1 Tax=Prauserella cavernicola TaxID=2800127 RepID=A0A934QQ23_9PSEU|nr:hypothetical protein [Prauserella cavernicola]MBK1783978.1 hypothetical protein [Prauserella cavernicola]
MKILRFALGAPVAVLACLLTASPATADATLLVDKSIVSPGEVVHVTAKCPYAEGISHVGSPAFAATGADGPYAGNGGVAVLTARSGGFGIGRAEIRADIAPGVYPVVLRCGGGNAGTVELTIPPG